MPRMLRLQTAGIVHHVISRFVDRSWQLTGDNEREVYLERLGRALARSDWTLLGYALMSSHVHLVLESGLCSLESWTKSTNSGMARWLNHRHGRLGPVFADRPYAEAVDARGVPHVLAYVHNNPVRARLVGWAGDIAWSSHRAYLGLERPRASLCVSRGLEICGYMENDAGRSGFDAWVRARVGDDNWAPEDTARQARLAARESVGAAVELVTPQRGPNDVQYSFAVPHGGTIGPVRRDATPDAVIIAVHQVSGVDARGRCARDRRPEVTRARRAALLIWARAGRPRIEMARALGIGASAASALVNRRPECEPHALATTAWARLGLDKRP